MFWMFLINTIGILMMWVAFWFLLIITQKGGSTSKRLQLLLEFFLFGIRYSRFSWAKKKRTIVLIPSGCRCSEVANGVLASESGRDAQTRARTIVPRNPNQGTGRRTQLGVKRTIIPSYGGCRSGHWVRLQRTIIRFADPGRSGPEQKKPRAVKLGAVILHSSRTAGGAKFYLFSNSWIFCLRIILNHPSPGVFFFLRSKRFNSFLSSSSSDILDVPFF